MFILDINKQHLINLDQVISLDVNQITSISEFTQNLNCITPNPNRIDPLI